ncbi:hypothetical protein TraAM80_02789 [Trypanosoma rangeli]|uniref:Uncharacterized protein n=1 Tax=Trypanosoma rangeli TaxID=5698 RepID=A0A422NS42_TRYRA|nr:uncharacterized protein TraAM80_02789 [Trypanosoma rangeli]RNF08283.1 hypothetical protein TraAM80_02789 [Trypanosoma rangeli]|eukprot:RNF08283.1 hypothetical protein TraAM80_02789 [Trypanosoma rangeli]
MGYINRVEDLQHDPSEGCVAEAPAAQPEADPDLARKNSVTITQMNSTLNGFCKFDPLAQAGKRTVGAGALEEMRLSARFTALPKWPGGSASVMTFPLPHGTNNGVDRGVYQRRGEGTA